VVHSILDLTQLPLNGHIFIIRCIFHLYKMEWKDGVCFCNKGRKFDGALILIWLWQHFCDVFMRYVYTKENISTEMSTQTKFLVFSIGKQPQTH